MDPRAPSEEQNVELVQGYLRALEGFATGHQLRLFLADDAIQVELPNALNPKGGINNVSMLLERVKTARTILDSQGYLVETIVAKGNVVAVEGIWNATLAIRLDDLPPGSKVKAYFAMFFTIKNGRITSQKTYDCFESWS